MTRYRLICIVGIDGSGKTTHVRKLLLDLQKNGTKCKYLWLRHPYFFALPFMAFCRVVGLTTVYKLGNKSYSDHEYYRNRPIALLWPWISLLDMIVITFFLRLNFSFRNITVICDRFVYDTLVDLIVDTHDYQIPQKIIGRVFLNIMPPNITVMLDVDELEAIRRKEDIPNVNYIKVRRPLYHRIAEKQGIPILNSGKSFERVHAELKSFITQSIDHFLRSPRQQ